MADNIPITHEFVRQLFMIQHPIVPVNLAGRAGFYGSRF